MDIEIRQYETTLYLGCGFDSNTGEAKGCCLDLEGAVRPFDPAQLVDAGAADFDKLSADDLARVQAALAKELYARYPRSDETSYKMRLAESEKEVREDLEINGKVTVTTPFIQFEGSAGFAITKMNREKSVMFTSTSKVMTVAQKVDPYQVEFRVNAGASDKYGFYNPGVVPANVFRERFGDCFVCGVIYGGDLDCTMDMKLKEEEDSMRVRAEAKMTYYAFDASGKFSLENKDYMLDRQVNIKCASRGGRLVHMPEEQAHVSRVSALFCGTVSGAGGCDVPVRVMIMPYAFLPQFGGNMPPPAPGGGALKSALTDLREDFDRIDGLIAAEMASFVLEAVPARREAYVRRLHRCRHLVLCSLERCNLALFYPHLLAGDSPPTVPPLDPGMLQFDAGPEEAPPPLESVQDPAVEEGMDLELVASVVPIPPSLYRYYLRQLRAKAAAVPIEEVTKFG